MNANRDLIWGITLSLLVHGAFLGLSFSPSRQRLTLPHQSIPLEISLVKFMGHEDAKPKMKLVPLSQSERGGQSVSISKRKVTKRREKWPVSLGMQPIPVLSGKPMIPLKEKTLTPTPEPLSPAPQRQIEENAPQPGGEMGGKASLASSLPSAESPIKEEDFKTSLIPKGGDSPKSRPIILARPRYDRNPKPSYPRIARRRGYEGVVVLKVEILPNGRVGQLRVKRSSGHHILDRSALKTVKQWKFIPAKQGEDPIRIWAEIPIKFELE
jgi:protein TonB